MKQKQSAKVPILFEKEKDCCGCYGCYSSCSNKAIRMKQDAEGFFYPQIDKEKCVNCGMCLFVCPIKSKLIDISQKWKCL